MKSLVQGNRAGSGPAVMQPGSWAPEPALFIRISFWGTLAECGIGEPSMGISQHNPYQSNWSLCLRMVTLCETNLEKLNKWLKQIPSGRCFKTPWHLDFWCPDWCGSVDRVLSHKVKGHQVNSQLVHMPGLWGSSPVWAYARGNPLILLSHIDVSLPLCLPPFPSL